MPAAGFNTPERIIRMALFDCGLIQAGQDPNSDQLADGMNRLNDMINIWQVDGLKLWLQYDLSIPLVASQGTYTISPTGNVVMTKPTRILDNGYYLYTNGNQRQLTMISRDEYMRLSARSQTGAITNFFVQKNALDLTVYFWLIPDAAEAAGGTAHMLIQQQAQNVVELSEELQFPIEWFMAMRWGLADDMATGQPQAIMDRCMNRAMFYKTKLDDWDVEDASTRIALNTDGQTPSRFR